MTEKQRYVLVNHNVRDKAAWAVKSAPEGWVVEIKPPTRSLEQNARLWAFLSDIAEQVEWYGQKLSPDDWKQVLSASLKQSRVVPSLEAGGFVVIGAKTSQMTKTEMSALLELATAFGTERGVVFGDIQE